MQPSRWSSGASRPVLLLLGAAVCSLLALVQAQHTYCDASNSTCLSCDAFNVCTPIVTLANNHTGYGWNGSCYTARQSNAQCQTT